MTCEVIQGFCASDSVLTGSIILCLWYEVWVDTLNHPEVNCYQLKVRQSQLRLELIMQVSDRQA